MKGLNVKRIAALGLGAALVGSALAPAVMAGFVNVDSIKKSDVISSSGAPIVDVVVGSLGQASDVVWAGNIASRIGQLATIDGEAASGSASVDFSVGGTTTMGGAGELAEGEFVFDSIETGLDSITVSNTKMPELINNPSAKVKWNSTSYSTTSVSEDLTAKIDASYNSTTGNNRYAVGEVVGTVLKNSIFYNVNLGAGIDMTNNVVGMDANSYYDVKIPFLGKTYVLDEIDKSEKRLVLYANTNPTDLRTGEVITVAPASGHSGKSMVIELVDLVQTGSGTGTSTYEAKWALKIDGSIEKYVQKAPGTSGYNLKDEFGSGYFTDDVYVTAAGLNLAAGTYTATIRSGTDRLELRDGYGFPYTGVNSVDQDAQWKVVFEMSGNQLTKISLTNQWKYDKENGSETSISKYVLKVGEEIRLPNDFAKLQFLGFQDKPTLDVEVGDVDGINHGGIKYYDAKGTEIKVPFYVDFDLDSNKPRLVTIGSQEYTFWTDFPTAGDLSYIKGDYSSAEDQIGDWTHVVNKVVTKTVLDTNVIEIDLGVKNKNGAVIPVEYRFVVDTTSEQAALLLDAQKFDIYDKAKSDTNAILNFVDTNTTGVAGGIKTYYVPNTQEFLDVIAATTFTAVSYNSDKYMSASLTYTDNLADTADLYVRTGETGSVWNYESIKDDTIYGPTKDAEHNNWISAIRSGSDFLQEGITRDGTLIVSDNSVFTISVPEEERLVEAYLGSTGTTETTTGGSSQSGVGVGETKGGVTITSISGCATSGKQIVPVGNFVKLDTDATSGKSIIVGGHLVNNMAKSLSVEGQTLEERLISDGDYVSAVLDNGSVVVAGWNASDTATAAKALINQLEELL